MAAINMQTSKNYFERKLSHNWVEFDVEKASCQLPIKDGKKNMILTAFVSMNSGYLSERNASLNCAEDITKT